eukprot:403360742
MESQQQQKPQQQEQQKRKISLKLISQDEAEQLKGSTQIERDRVRNLQLLIKLKPGVFDPIDQAENEEYIRQIKITSIFVAFGFIATTAFRIWQIKTQDKNIMGGLTVILASYIPALSWYSYHNRNYQRFLGDVSERYRNRIGEDHFNRFKQQDPQAISNENLERLRKIRENQDKKQ